MRMKIGAIKIPLNRVERCILEPNFARETTDCLEHLLILDVVKENDCNILIGIWNRFQEIEIDVTKKTEVPIVELDWSLPPILTPIRRKIRVNLARLAKANCGNVINDLESIDIIIPTLRKKREIQGLIDEIERNTPEPHRIIATCQEGSAAENRNFGLDYANSKIGIMVDDDMKGFFPGWLSELVRPMLKNKMIAAVSARLVNPNGTIPPTCANNIDLSRDYIQVSVRKDSVMPSACIAYRNIGLKFDTRYVGSGWEETDWFFQYLKKNRNYLFLINNKCRLIHTNEMKNQYTKTPRGTHFEINKRAFYAKWKVAQDG